MLKKNEEYNVEIVDNGFTGEGIAKIEDKVIFVPGAIKGEKVRIKILKVNSSICYAKLIDIIESSDYRIEHDSYQIGCNIWNGENCPLFIGVCPWNKTGDLFYLQGKVYATRLYTKALTKDEVKANYDKTLEIKKLAVETTIKKMLHKDIKVQEVIKMEEPYYYRNKLQYPIGLDKDGNITMGVFAERSHTIIPTKTCKIQDKLCQNIANDLFLFARENNISAYNEQSGEGILRHFVIRIGRKTNEVMVIIVVNDFNIPKEKEMVDYILQKYSQIKTIVKNLNNKKTNVILGLKCKNIFGPGYIYDYLGDKKFKISPLSFYQVNPIQTEKLYSKAVEYADLKGNETIFDLYCGIGTIGIFASNSVKKIYGIAEAIEDAKQNARLNNIENAEFFVGDVENKLPEFIKERNIKPDCIFIDPPRKGCDKIAIETLLKIEAKKIVYISCNPATFARDLSLLESKYELKKLAICDMFPFTSHVECVVAMSLR